MSGKKRSRYTANEEVRRTPAVSQTRKSVEQIRIRIRKEVAVIPEIIQDRLTSLTTTTERWLSDADAALRGPMSPTASEMDVTSWQSRARTGESLLLKLSASVQLETDRYKTLIESANEESASRLESHRSLIEKWLTPTVVPGLERLIASAKSTLERGDLPEALRESTAVSKEVLDVVELAKQKEGQHIHNEVLRNAQQMHRDLMNSRYALTATCNKASESAGIEFDECQRWLREIEPLISSVILDSESNQNLERLLQDCRAAVTTGNKLLTEARREFEQVMTELRSEFGTRLHTIQQKWASEEDGMERWLSVAERESAEACLAEWQKLLSQDSFGRLKQRAASTEASLTECLDRLSSLKKRHESRLYVLKALRQVCVNLGFREVSPPRHLVDGDYTSRIALIVNTFNRGQITFYLSLDEIEADSCFEKSHCHSDFGKLSEQLRNHFGIHTDFETVGTAPPQVIKKDEIDEPTGSSELTQA